MNTYWKNLLQTVIDSSESDTWDDAVMEWEITDCEEDEEVDGVCLCGKEKLRYLYEIRNQKNNHVLFPIGSCCIRKFERTDLKEHITIQEQLFRLLHAIRDKKRIEVTTEFFSRKLLRYLYKDGAFPATDYNHGDGWYDYDFLLDIFNGRGCLSNRQKRKINGIIAYSLKPYLERKLKDKIKSSKMALSNSLTSLKSSR